MIFFWLTASLLQTVYGSEFRVTEPLRDLSFNIGDNAKIEIGTWTSVTIWSAPEHLVLHHVVMLPDGPHVMSNTRNNHFSIFSDYEYVTIPNIDLTDEGLYGIDLITDFGKKVHIDVKINVIVPPSRANINFDVSDGNGDFNVKINGFCHVTGEKPKASIKWFTDGIPLNFTDQPEISLITSWEDLGKEISCTVNHLGLKQPIVLKKNLTVHFKPRKPTLKIDQSSCERDQKNMKFICDLPEKSAFPGVDSYQWFSEGSLFGNQVIIALFDFE